MSDSNNPVKRLLTAAEDKFQDAVDELMTNPRFAEAIGRRLERAATARDKVSRNLTATLGLLNLTTKADYDDIVRRVVQLGETIAGLEARLAHMSARLERLGHAAGNGRKVNKR